MLVTLALMVLVVQVGQEALLVMPVILVQPVVLDQVVVAVVVAKARMNLNRAVAL